MAEMSANRERPTLTDRISDAAFRFVMARALRKPWEERIPYMGRMMAGVVAPLSGHPRRIEANLAFIYPDMPPAERARIARAASDNVGRSLAEMYSGAEFSERCRTVPVEGPGLAALEAAQAAGKGAVLISGHYGNYDVTRTALVERGYEIASIYRPMNNPLFNAHYVEMLTRVGPAFIRNGRGLAQAVRYLRGKRVVAMVTDQHFQNQPVLDFMGKPAHTSVIPAELALRYEVPLICIYATRQPDGLSFRVNLEEPIPPTTPEEMMQAFNDSLGAMIAAHPEQWLWNHRRWRVKGNCP